MSPCTLVAAVTLAATHLSHHLHRYTNDQRGIFLFQAEDGIRDGRMTGVQTCALPIFTGQASLSVPQGKVSHDGMVCIPGGTFMMGAQDQEGRLDEYPAHKVRVSGFWMDRHEVRSEEHTSELQSPVHLVCRLLLEKKKK